MPFVIPHGFIGVVGDQFWIIAMLRKMFELG